MDWHEQEASMVIKQNRMRSFHGIREKHKPNNRKRIRKNLETASNFVFSSFVPHIICTSMSAHTKSLMR